MLPLPSAGPVRSLTRVMRPVEQARRASQGSSSCDVRCYLRLPRAILYGCSSSTRVEAGPAGKGDKVIRYLCSSIVVLVMCAPFNLSAQQLKVGQDAELRSVPKWDVPALDAGAFGERHNTYTGATEFVVTDVSVPGNNQLEVAVRRRLRNELWKDNYLFADWELDFPRLEGIFSSAGWQVSTTGARDQRCSVNRQNFMQATPPTVTGTSIGSQPANFAFSSEEYWYGNSLHLPGEGDQRMLVLTPDNTSFNHGTYHWITRGNWVFSCLPNTANGKPGEAFLARSPNGQTYKFDWLVENAYKPIEKTAVPGGLGSLTSRLNRKRVLIYPTEVTDENGNWVRYQFNSSNQLISISSSDGRLIQITYSNNRITSVSTAGRTWTYSYHVPQVGSMERLSQVVLPDDSRWTLRLDLNGYEVGYGLHSTACANETGAWVGDPMQGYMIHPSGLRGDFHFIKRYHGITFTPRNCVPDGYGGMTNLRPDRYPVVSLTKKQLSGPGLPTYSWDFDYGWSFRNPDLISGYVDGCASQTCPTTRVVNITRSDGTWERLTFNAVFGDTEGLQIQSEIGEGAAVLRGETTTYEAAIGQVFPAVYGKDPCHRCHRSHERVIPVRERRADQQGRYFYWRAESFDAFARPINVVKYSTPIQ